jgi:hypothetical protein
MNASDLDEMKKLLKSALPSVRSGELQRDLWPTMLQKLDERTLRVPWWDWALLSAVVAAFCFYPGLLPALLYHL